MVESMKVLFPNISNHFLLRKALFGSARNGPECGLFRPDGHGPVPSKVGLGWAVRFGLAWNENWAGLHFSHFLARNGSTSELLRIGSKAGTELRQGLSETMGFT